jgi:hypothetical protein
LLVVAVLVLVVVLVVVRVVFAQMFQDKLLVVVQQQNQRLQE